MPNSIPSPILAIAEIGSNRLLALDEDIVRRCAALQGKCIAIEITDLEICLYCHPGSWGLRLSQDLPPKDIDATICGRLFALFDLALEEDKVSASIRERVSIHGDASVAQQMQKIIGDIDIDWEEVLSQYTGDVLAFQIHQKIRQAGDFLRHSVTSLMQTNSEYLHEEVRMTPTRPEFERFSQQVTAIKQDVDRVDAKIRHLLKSAQENKSS